MEKDKIKIKIISHEKIVFEKDAKGIYLQGTEGRFGILPNHIAITSALDIGVTKVVTDSKPIFLTTMGGVLQFQNNEAVILTDMAELGSDIDLARAKQAHERAKARLEAQTSEVEIMQAQLSLAKAIARLKAGRAQE